MSLMLSVYLGEGPHTVRGLAQTLRISKPAVSRALDRLGELGYVYRQRDDLDRRNVLVQRTQTGARFLTDFGHLIEEAKEFVSASIPSRMIEFAVEAPSMAPAQYEETQDLAAAAAE
jgi:DNA-binding MarR family transcriptional regulator